VIRVQSFAKESSGFVGKILIFYMLGASLVIGGSLVALQLRAIHRSMLDQVDAAAVLVESALAVSGSDLNRQSLLQAYTQKMVANDSIGLNALFALDRSGRIVYSSRPAWLNLMIYDGLFTGSRFNNPGFRKIAACFQADRPDCVSLRSDKLPFVNNGFTSARPVFRPSPDLGLPREPFLVVVSYSGALGFISVLQMILPLLALAALLAGLLTAALWLALRLLVLPRLAEVAQTDGLTRLMNRSAFMETAIEALAEAEEQGADLVFAILDFDHFKRINDAYGHDCGDVALVSLSAVLATVLRGDDVVCRFGGEEFALLLSSDQQSGEKVLERLRIQLEMSRVSYHGREIPVTVSIGAASTTECGYNLDYLYTSADSCLYAAKQAGRNRVVWARSRRAARLQLDRHALASPLVSASDVDASLGGERAR
jgi:diguanylate cyclase (GGDEF)-like protein